MILQDIKLIIWDLDETFWNGTISEGDIVTKDENIKFLRDTLDMGIVHSICSKNDFNVVKSKLIDFGLWDCFVFPSIDWTPKGGRVEKIISTMKLRPANVLFIDDNIQNLEEAKHFCADIMVALPTEIGELISEATKAEHKDLQHKRLKQYHQMEEKEAMKGEYSSNEEFLMSCNICVKICTDCVPEAERLHELIMRSNQLNFTKLRQSKEEFDILIKDPAVKCGYVSVTDKFGDYGIVGFYAMRGEEVIHFVFSCRTLGMQIEQYVYNFIGSPEINVVGEVVAKLQKDVIPEWINQANPEKNEQEICPKSNCNILFKGPCDMSQMYVFFDVNNAVTEFSYTNDSGVLTEGHNHTSQIVTALKVDNKRKNEILSDTDFFDKSMLDTALRTEKFDFVVLSMLTDGNLGVYKRKKTGECVALCKKCYSLTDIKNAEKYINGEYFTSGIKFTKAGLKNFSEKYEYLKNDNGKLTIENLNVIREHLGNSTTLILLLGSEREFKKDCSESYYNRHNEHKILNAEIRKWAKDKPNVILLPYDKYIKSDADFVDTINHFSKKVYYELAIDLMKIFGASKTANVKIKGKSFLIIATIKQKLRMQKDRLKKILTK